MDFFFVSTLSCQLSSRQSQSAHDSAMSSLHDVNRFWTQLQGSRRIERWFSAQLSQLHLPQLFAAWPLLAKSRFSMRLFEPVRSFWADVCSSAFYLHQRCASGDPKTRRPPNPPHINRLMGELITAGCGCPCCY